MGLVEKLQEGLTYSALRLVPEQPSGFTDTKHSLLVTTNRDCLWLAYEPYSAEADERFASFERDVDAVLDQLRADKRLQQEELRVFYTMHLNPMPHDGGFVHVAAFEEDGARESLEALAEDAIKRAARGAKYGVCVDVVEHRGRLVPVFDAKLLKRSLYEKSGGVTVAAVQCFDGEEEPPVRHRSFLTMDFREAVLVLDVAGDAVAACKECIDYVSERLCYQKSISADELGIAYKIALDSVPDAAERPSGVFSGNVSSFGDAKSAINDYGDMYISGNCQDKAYVLVVDFADAHLPLSPALKLYPLHYKP